jgi:hypothetical protein
MTKQEIDNYLQSIGGLKNGFKLESNPIVDSDFFAVREGWFPLIKDLIVDLIELGWNKEICQVKEKFGGLRFYINDGTDEMFDRIHKAERESCTICEITGNPGKLRTDISWHRTLCDEQYEYFKSNRN